MSDLKTSSLSRNLPPPGGVLFPVLTPVERRQRRKSRDYMARRWTTGIEKGQLPIPIVVDESMDDSSVTLSQELPSSMSLSSWGSTLSDFDNGDSHVNDAMLRTPTPTSVQSSQADVVQELLHMNKSFLTDNVSNHQYQLSYELAVDSFPLSPSHYTTAQQVTYCYNVIHELVSTEMRYVKDLSDIIEGYYVPLNAKVGILSITEYDMLHLFGNIEEIRDSHRHVLKVLQASEKNIKRIGECFISQAEDFKRIYTEYCNNYPRCVETLAKITGDKGISLFMKMCQQRLNHLLPLGAYLLKPVQRVLKYSLLLESLARHMTPVESGYNELVMGTDAMTRVAEHINEMKKKYDAAVHAQEIQSLLHGWEGKDLVKYGEIVLEDTFRVIYSKTGTVRPSTSAFRSAKETYVFLFKKLLLITKKRDKDEAYQYKYHTEMKDMQLTEHLKISTCFQIRQISTKSTLTFQARSIELKKEWSEKIKELLMESVPHLPDKAKLLILAGFPTDLRKTSPQISLDRKRKTSVESVESPTQQHRPLVSTKSGSSVTPQFSPKGTSVSQNSRKVFSSKTPVKPTLSLLQAGLAGLAVGSSSSPEHKKNVIEEALNNRFKRDSGFSESPSVDELKRNKKLRFGSLPYPLSGKILHHSDSDPNMLEDSRPDSRGSVDISSHTPSPVTPQFRDSPIDRTPQQSSPESPPNDDDTCTSMTNLDVGGLGVKTSVSSPNLKLSEEDEDDKDKEKEEDKDNNSFSDNPQKQLFPDNLTDNSEASAHLNLNGFPEEDNSDITTDHYMSLVSPSASSELSYLSIEEPHSHLRHIEEQDSLPVSPIHMRTKSAPLSIHEPVLETIHSCENTPTRSYFQDGDNHVLSDDELSFSPLMIMQSTNSNENSIIEIKPSLEVSMRDRSLQIGNDKNGELFEPPLMFTDSEDHSFENVTCHTLDTNSSHHKDELLFQELMSSRLSPITLSKSDITVPKSDQATLNEILSQPDDTIDDDLIKSIKNVRPNCVPVIDIDPPTQFQINTKLVIHDNDIIINPAFDDTMDDDCSDAGKTPLHTPPPQFRFNRSTTPYTSIEDLPSEISDEKTSTDKKIKNTPLILPSPVEFAKLFRNDSEPLIQSLSLKRGNSFQFGRRGSKRKKSTSFESSEKPDSGKLSFLRPPSSSRTQRNQQRPISVIGLVHSTRDNSDLVDLDDAILLNKQLNNDRREREEELLLGTEVNRRKNIRPLDLTTETTRSISSTPQIFPTKTKVSSESPSSTSITPDVSDVEESPKNKIKDHEVKNSPNVRRNRWSLLRSWNRRVKEKREDSTSGSDSRQSSASDLEKVNKRSTTNDSKGVSESLFNIGGTPDRRRRVKIKKDKRRLTIAGTEFHEEETLSELPPSRTLSPPGRRQSRVEQLAKEYSLRIKEKSPNLSMQHLPLTEETITSLSPSSQNSDMSGTSPTPTQQWLKSLYEKRRQREETMSAGNLQRLQTSPDLSTEKKISLSPERQTVFLTPRSQPVSPVETLTPSSPNTIQTFQYGDPQEERQFTETVNPTSLNLESNLQRYASENVLSKLNKAKHDESIRKKPGWVRSLIQKFSSK